MKAIGIDIGTTSICLVLYEQKNNEILECISIDNHFLNDTFRQDADAIVKAVTEQLDILEKKYIEIDTIGISTQMHGILYIDSQGNAVSPFYTWKEECGNHLYEGIEGSEWISKKTGYAMYTGYGTVTHFVMGKEGKIPSMAVKFIDIGDYLAMKLCHLQKAEINQSLAASFGGFDMKTGNFDVEALRETEIDIEYFPDIVKDEEIYGWFHHIPVWHAIGDNQASFYAVAGEDEEVISINVGTGSQVSISDSQLTALQTGEIRPFVGQKNLYVQTSINGGKVYEKLADYFKEIIFEFTGENIDVYEKMMQIGLQKDKTDLIIVPSLYGARGKKNNYGFIKNITEFNFHPGDFIRAYVSGMAQELFDLYSNFPEFLRKKRTRIVASGNGMRKNKLLVQELEQKFDMKVEFKEWKEEAATGAAMIAVKYLDSMN